MMRAAAYRDSGAHAGSQNDRKDHVVAGARAVNRFGHGQTIGVVDHADLAPERRAHIFLDELAEQPGRVAAFALPGDRVERPRDADADRTAASGFGLDLVDHVDDQFDAARVIALWRRLANAQQLGAARFHRDAFDFGAAPVDADQHAREYTRAIDDNPPHG
jgi:hypothetical protein